MRRVERSVTTEITSATDNRLQSAISAGTMAKRTTGCSGHHELNLLGADEVLVAVFDLAALDSLLVVPGAVGRAEVFDEVVAALADDHRVLAADLAGVDHEVAVLAAADHEPVFRD